MREGDRGTFQLRTNFIEVGEKNWRQIPESRKGERAVGMELPLAEWAMWRDCPKGQGPSSGRAVPPRKQRSAATNVLRTYWVLFAYTERGLRGLLYKDIVSYLQRQLYKVTQTILLAQGLWPHLS